MNEKVFAVRRRCGGAGAAGCGARANQRDRHRHHHHDHRTCRGTRHSRAQLAGVRRQGNRRRAAEGHRARRWRRSHHGDHQCAALRDGIQGRHHHGLVDHAAEHRGFQRRGRGEPSAFRPRAVPDHAGARQVVGVDAAADPDRRQGHVRPHEEEQREDRRLYRLLRFLRRSLDQRSQEPGRSDGHERRRRGTLCASRHVRPGPGAEAASLPIPTRSWSARPAPPPHCRRPRCASAATRA